MNPHLDVTHFNADSLAKLAALGIQADPYTGMFNPGGPGSISDLVDFTTFNPDHIFSSDMISKAKTVFNVSSDDDAIAKLSSFAGELLLESIGDHYVAGDGGAGRGHRRKFRP